MARIVVTGAAGFIGRALSRNLAERGHQVIGIVRAPAPPIPAVEFRPLGDIGPDTAWAPHLRGAEIAVHLAATAHRRLSATARDTEPETAGQLLREAARAGVRRAVLMSSIKAMGDITRPGKPFTAADRPGPASLYGEVKRLTEAAAAQAAEESGVELVILRPPLVYGPGVKANFRALMRLAASGLPLPFAGIDNRRSLVFLDNLVDLVAAAAFHPAAAGRILLGRDTLDLSTPQLVEVLAAAFGRRSWLYPLPRGFWALGRRLPLIGGTVGSLTASLQVDDSETRALLDWRPPVPLEDAISRTARAFAEEEAV